MALKSTAGGSGTTRRRHCQGPFLSEQAVCDHLNTSRWIPTPRFPLVQKNKVRGVDGATCSGINGASQVTEKLALSSTDANVGLIRRLVLACPDQPLEGWVLDEAKAYRQIGVRPDQRKYSVVTMLHPDSLEPAFFVVVGHSFGWVSAVYNYNRRSRLINELLCKEFGVPANFFYDDKFGFDIKGLGEFAHTIVQDLHCWLGVLFDASKLQFGVKVEVLGIDYDLAAMELRVKEKRRAALLEDIDRFLEANIMSPQESAKLKGKLMFAASQFWGRLGRAFMLALSERQKATPDKVELSLPCRLALLQWRLILLEGRPRSLCPPKSTSVEVVIFTDGYFPDPRRKEVGMPGIGGVCCVLGEKPLFFSEWVMEAEMSV